MGRISASCFVKSTSRDLGLMAQNMDNMIPADLLEELTQPFPTFSTPQLESTREPLPASQIPPWDDPVYMSTLADIWLPTVYKGSLNALNAEQPPTSHAEFKTPTKSPVDPIAPDAPKKKKSKRCKQVKTSDVLLEKTIQQYDDLTMDQLKEVFIDRFHPPSQKRLNDRLFMIQALIEYDHREDHHEESSCTTAEKDEAIPAKEATPATPTIVGDSCSKCVRCGRVWSWMHPCPSDKKPPKPKQPVMLADSLLFKTWLDAL